MNGTLPTIPLASLLLAFLPSILLIGVMWRWSLGAREGLYANGRMLAQLLIVGYVLTTIFETDEPWAIAAVLVLMVAVAAWIALRPLASRSVRLYLVTLAALGGIGLPMLALVTQLVLELPRFFEPRFVVPLAGMIFANAMNTVSLAAERFEAERSRGLGYVAARRVALDAALIPQVNALLAVGLVSLPGMMTGQILSGVEPLVAVRYQIMVMCMTFGSAGLAAALYLVWVRSAEPAPPGVGAPSSGGARCEEGP
jgi:putative ABC transport system permease protein